MTFKPRGMQRINRFGLQAGNAAGTDTGSSDTSSSEADVFLSRASRMRTGHHVEEQKLTKGEERRLKLMRLRGPGKPAATSAAHMGVHTRPAEDRVSKLLDQRRAQHQGRSTSAARIRRHGEEDDTEETEETSETADANASVEQGTSVHRIGPDAQLNLQPLPPGLLHPAPPKKDEPPDMEI